MTSKRKRKAKEAEAPRGLRTLEQAQERLSVGRKTIYKLAREGQLELVKLGSRMTRVTERSLRRLEEGGEDKPGEGEALPEAETDALSRS